MVLALAEGIVPENPHHRYSKCFFMRIDGETIDKESVLANLLNRSHNPRKYRLSLIVRFGEDWISLGVGKLGLGKAKFGVRGGELTLKVHNGEIPAESCWPKQEFRTNHEISLRIQEDEEETNTSNADLSINKIKALLSTVWKKTSGITQNTNLHTSQVSVSGPEDSTVWTFRLGIEEEITNTFAGEYEVPEIGKLLVKDDNCKIDSKFKVANKDIVCTGTKGIWMKEVFKGQKAKEKIVRIGLARMLLEEELIEPYLSSVVLEERSS